MEIRRLLRRIDFSQQACSIDGDHRVEILRLIAAGEFDTTPLITHRIPLSRIAEAYWLFENRLDGVIKV